MAAVTRRRPAFAATALVAAALVSINIHAQTTRGGNDAIGRAIADFASLVAAETSSDRLWTEAKPGVDANVKDARAAIAAGRRWLAVERLSQARQSFLAIRFALDHPAERKDLAAFESEWTRQGATLGAAAPQPAPLASVRPAVLRALAEVAASQVRINYDAGLEYGRNTQPEYGLYYVGVAEAQRQFITLARGLSPVRPDRRTPPPLRSVAADIAVVQRDLLSLYQPPASVDRHSEFIVASSALKEARQYDAAGWRYAALIRFLQGTQRTAMLGRGAPSDMDALAKQIASFRARLEDPRIDHSIGLLFVERAEAALGTRTAVGSLTAATVAMDVLPRYFAAIVAAEPTTRTAEVPVATVTLVRWPFT
jgi:hypothetical protein